MLLKNFHSISKPIQKKWKNFEYNSIERKSIINVALKHRNLIVNFNETIDDMFLEAYRYYSNLNFIIFFNTNKVNTYNFYSKHLSNNIVLYGIKTLNLSIRCFRNFLYQIYFDCKDDRIKSYEDINLIVRYILNSKYPKKVNFSVLIFKEKNSENFMKDIENIPKNNKIKVYLPKNKLQILTFLLM